MTKIQSAGDKLAIFLSSLCVLHCVLTPILIIAIPAVGSMVAVSHDTFHDVLLYFVVPVGLAALGAGFIHHRNVRVLLVGLCGLILLAIAALAGHDNLSEAGETVLTILASCLIVVAHVFNLRLRRKSTHVEAQCSGKDAPCER